MNIVAVKPKLQDSIPVKLGMSINFKEGDITEVVRVDNRILFKVKQVLLPQQALTEIVDDESSNCFQPLRSTLDQMPTHPAQNIDGASSTLSLQERLIELESQGIWVAAKDPDTRITLGEPAIGALERFLADR